MLDESVVRDHLAKSLAWEEAHASFDAAVTGVPLAMQGTRPSGLPYSAWQLLEHLRRTQRDILEFCRNPNYQEMKWPDDYWPKAPAPPSDTAWDESVDQFQRDRSALQQLARDPAIDLTSRIPHGDGQTYLRELLLVADHSAYHVGELVVLRRQLGIWSRG